MVLTTYRKKGIRLSHVWFATEEELASLVQSQKGKTDLVYAHGLQVPCGGWRAVSSQNTLIKMLDSDESVIYQTFGKHLRKFIQRSISEGTVIRLLSGTEITDEVLDTCLRLYNKMKKDKGLSGTFNTALAKKYAAAGNLIISQACVGATVIGFKSSVIDDRHLRGWVSAFAFREEKFDTQVVSRAHQLLEWETMRWCCRNGITSYDFGGIASFDDPNGIDKFKMTFAKEGQRATYDNYLVGISPLGKAAVLGYWLLKEIRKKGRTCNVPDPLGRCVRSYEYRSLGSCRADAGRK